MKKFNFKTFKKNYQTLNLKDLTKIYRVTPYYIYKWAKSYNLKSKLELSQVPNIKSRNWILINKCGVNDNGANLWKIKCTKCNNIRIKTTSQINQINSNSCGCLIKGGYKEITGNNWGNIVCGAKSRNLEFSITIEYVWDLFLKQDRRCALTKLYLIFGNKISRTASLDRIDSSKGYIEGNVQWVHKDVNKMKMNIIQSRFLELCDLISQNIDHSNDIYDFGRETFSKYIKENDKGILSE